MAVQTSRFFKPALGTADTSHGNNGSGSNGARLLGDGGGRQYLSWAEVIALTTLSESTLRREINKGRFPAPAQLSDNRVGFDSDEVHAYLRTRPRVHYCR